MEQLIKEIDEDETLSETQKEFQKIQIERAFIFGRIYQMKLQNSFEESK